MKSSRRTPVDGRPLATRRAFRAKDIGFGEPIPEQPEAQAIDPIGLRVAKAAHQALFDLESSVSHKFERALAVKKPKMRAVKNARIGVIEAPAKEQPKPY